MNRHCAYRTSKSMLKLVIFCTFTLGAVGCLSRHLPPDNDQIKCEHGGGFDPFTNSSFDPGSKARLDANPLLRVVEFTDDGEFVNRCQLSDVIYAVRGTPRATGTQIPPVKVRTPKLVVIYIHGWKHDADTQDNDVLQFQTLLKQLKTLESHRDKPRDVVGIFIGWPGRALDVPILDNLSFWGRKGGADRVAAAGNVAKLLSSIRSVSCLEEASEDFIVGIGHSFGGRVLYTATAPMFINALAMSHPGNKNMHYEQISGVIDLTILLNPAFEASRYTALAASRRYQETLGNSQQPVLLTVSTDNDLATRYAFPTGQILGTRWRERERTTLGNHQPYQTHTLSSSEGLPASGENFWYDSFCQSNICLKNKDTISGYPFIVASTDATVLNGHNGIWSEDFKSWLSNFIEVSSAKQGDAAGSGLKCPTRSKATVQAKR
ncbi:hypothetical protein [Pseudomonas maumuensis]|uniref:Alpha/beta hydrolase n=1 Tax=Pseudomonas maumuensis TaxID=2842354 RepID=A0ABX8NG45_9PSED|nr:hypothetical protein [Pseudomonas maumuensis]QXH55112.1 hypothetical protein KSS90_17395 [Pseudomonas maumuensis]